MPRIRVLIVDDAVVMRRMISEALGSDPELEVVGTAANGRIALQKVTQVNPDIITMDVEMPDMDGLEAVRELRKTHPALPVIMFSTLTMKGAASTLEALAAGATDYVTKPANVGNVIEGIDRLKSELVPKIKLHCRRLLPNGSGQALQAAPSVTKAIFPNLSQIPAQQPQVLAIGCSTGGPNALAQVFGDILGPIPVPGVIVQHMPPLFTKMLAERLGKNSPNRFHEGEDGQPVEAGSVYIAPGGKHMDLVRTGPMVRLRLTDEPPENSCRPSVDVLFRSVAAVYGPATLAVIMTGMGQDGLHGCQHIRERGGRVVVQDEATSIVWGMPGYVANAGLAEKILPLQQIGGELMKRLGVRQPLTL